MKISAAAACAASFVLALASLLLFSPIPSLRAQQPAAMMVPVALAPTQKDSPVELVALTLDADIVETNGHTIISGNSTFKLHNTDRLNDLQVPVGFPGWAGDPFAFDPSRLASFSATLDGKKLSLAPSRADLKIGSAVRNVDWYSFTLQIAGDEKKTVRIDFAQDLGDGALPRFTFGLVPAANWKGSIGSARLSLRFPDATTLEQVATYDPPDPAFDGTTLTWNYTSHNPVSNPTLTFVRPSLWSDLVARRRAVQSSPNDAGAHAGLGSLLRQLASIGSMRQDSYYAQAVAELETATRLDPNQRSARQALAALYETRAGPATGPRQSAYVLLAVAQWETLAPNDAAARKQLAEDYYYLGVDAQTRGAFQDALAYYDKATALLPTGAGPLFTPERATAQRRSLNIAWARALLDQDNFLDAQSHARLALGDSFMTSFSPPAFTVPRAQVTMADHSRTMALRLVPFAISADELQKSVNDVAKAFQAAGADTTIVPASSDVDFTVVIPFETDADLKQKLEALVRATPDRPEWALARAIIQPSELTWQDPGGLMTNRLDYSEQVDLAGVCQIAEDRLSALSANLRTLETAPATDQEAQLKRALLKTAQNGWNKSLAEGRVIFRTGSNEENAEACAVRTITISSSPVRIELIALVAGIIGLLSLAAILIIWQSASRRRARRHVRPGRRS